jgi:Domain of unknown function (DUF4258)
MGQFLQTIKQLVSEGRLIISVHAAQEMADEQIDIADIIDGLDGAIVVETYPDYHKGPCVLVLLQTTQDGPVHALLGTSHANPDIAALITAYRPAPGRWNEHFTKRVTK